MHISRLALTRLGPEQRILQLKLHRARSLSRILRQKKYPRADIVQDVRDPDVLFPPQGHAGLLLPLSRLAKNMGDNFSVLRCCLTDL